MVSAQGPSASVKAHVWVIIPVYGRLDVMETVSFLRRLEGAFRLEFIVVDNGNVPGISNRLSELAGDDCTIVRLETNLGGSGAYRAGMETAVRMGREGYAWLLDDDARPDENTLSGLLTAFARDKRNAGCSQPIGIVGSTVMSRDEPLRVVESGCRHSFFRGHMRQLNHHRLLSEVGEHEYEVDYVSAASCLADMEVLTRVGSFESVFIHYDDMDWCYRAREAGYRIVSTTNSCVWHPEGAAKCSVWILYYDFRNRLWFTRKHLSRVQCLGMWVDLLERYFWWWLHGGTAALELMSLGISHARRGRCLLRSELPLRAVPKLSECVAGADLVGILARPPESAAAMLDALKAVDARNVSVIVCRRLRMGKVMKYLLAFLAQVRMQLKIWRSKNPVVLQDGLCTWRYPLPVWGAKKVFFTVDGGRVELLPAR